MNDYKLDLEKYATLARQAAAEGCVLLENEKQALPLREGESVAVFGRMAFHYYKSGLGSGGLVNTRYVVGILDALKECKEIQLDEKLLGIYANWIKENPYDEGQGWGRVPWSQKEMEVTEEMLDCARSNDVSLVIIGRTAGEDQDNNTNLGSYCLTETEEDLICRVCEVSKCTVVVLNVGNIIDMSWVEKYHPQAVLYAWQGGQEGGNGVADVLTGKVCACGKLTDTIAERIEYYPSTENFGDPYKNYYKEDIYVGYRYFETFAKEKVRYPFGYGLSYTTFDVQAALDMCSLPAGLAKGEFSKTDTLQVTYDITNTGDVAGKETIQFYVQKPQGFLGKPSRELIRFAKTELLEPGEGESGILAIDFYALSSYDDSGITGHAFCYVLEEGTYTILAGTNVRNAKEIGSFALTETVVLEELSQQLAPRRHLERMTPKTNENGTLVPIIQAAPVYLQHYSEDTCPQCADYTGDKGYKLDDVKRGIVSMDEFLAQLSDLDLCHIVKGEGMSSPKVTPGTAAAFGGLTPNLTYFGIPAGCCTDGPSGLRMDCGTNAFSLPGGTLLACTFNTSLNADLFEMEGIEMRNNHIESLLGPGMNIHRCPLNGRNFEYYSEDSVLAGYIGASSIAGAQSYGVYAYMKHFALNDQQINQSKLLCTWADEQAIREIYLRPFEISAKVGGCKAVMSSWNYIGNQWAGACNALLNGVLRGEWGFRGMVITDGFHFTDYMDSDIAIRNGCDLMLKNYDVATNHLTDTTSATSVKAMRQACKNIMYTVVNSRVYDPANTVSTPIWRTAMIVVNVLLAVLLVVLEVLTFKSYKKKKAQ